MLSEGRAGFHPNRGFIKELKTPEERQLGFQMTGEVEAQVSEHIWPYLNHQHLQGMALMFYNPPGPAVWKLPDCQTSVMTLMPRLVLSEGRAGFHPNRGFIKELKTPEERQLGFQMTGEVEAQVSEHIWPYLNHQHLQGMALMFYNPPGPAVWKLPDCQTSVMTLMPRR